MAVRCSGVEHAKCSSSLADHALSPPPKKRRRKGADAAATGGDVAVDGA